MRALFVSLAAGGGLILAAASCFSERVGGSNHPITGGNGSCNIPLSVIDSGHVVVAINGFAFQPDSVKIAPGQTVTWINCETQTLEPHTSTGDTDDWDSPQLSPGQRFSHTFPSAPDTTYTYHCTPHPFMVGKVVVQ